MAGLGFDVVVETGAGSASRIPDSEFEKAGARIGSGKDAGSADVVLKVRRPSSGEIKHYKSGAIVIAIMDPYGNEAALGELAAAGLTSFAMELMPRITRAQSMDVLSSQANLAGYQAVIDAAAEFDRAMPMMMTAAGTVPAASVFVMGAGVAGLQAIATARRLGAVVSATDVRPAPKEQVASLGAKFIAVEDEEFKAAETAGGYAKEMSAEYQAKQAALTAEHLAKQDIVITTALIPGRPAPRLITREMLKRCSRVRSPSTSPSSAAAISRARWPGRSSRSRASRSSAISTCRAASPHRPRCSMPRTCSPSSRPWSKDTKELALNRDDELVKATMLTHGGDDRPSELRRSRQGGCVMARMNFSTRRSATRPGGRGCAAPRPNMCPIRPAQLAHGVPAVRSTRSSSSWRSSSCRSSSATTSSGR